MSHDATSSRDIADQFVLLNASLARGDGADATLGRLVDLAVTTVPRCRWAALTAWPQGRPPRSRAASGPTAQRVDDLQYALGSGPCLTAAADSELAYIRDLATDERWPAFSRSALSESPVRSVASLPLGERPSRTALNLYADRAKAFDLDTLTVAAVFAAHAKVLLLHVAARERMANLEAALVTSREIGAAVGVLMNAQRVTAEEAFELLRHSSQRLHRKLHEVAEHVTRTGTLPAAGSDTT